MTDVTGQDQAQTSAVDFVALKPGQRIGRYEIVSILGQGGFGITYKAKDTQLGREVAIKEYLPSALAIRQDGVTVLPRSTKVAEDFTSGRQRFVEEGRTLANLQRAPAIVRVFDYLEANGTAYIVMELAPGETLEDRLRRGDTLKAAEMDRIVWPLLDGLEQVHAIGFLHRDIKPANILLSAEGNPTLIDFGAARAAMAGGATAMTAIFTPGYAAAEQFTLAKQGPWTDIYGLAATLYHAIAGAPPPSAFDRMMDDTYEPLAKVAPTGFAPGLLIGIDAGLEVRASDRPQSIAGWRAILSQDSAPAALATVALAKSAQAEATRVQRRAPAVRADKTRSVGAGAKGGGRGLWIGLAVVLLLSLGGGGYYYATRPVPPDPAAVEAARRQQEAAEAEAAKQKARDQELEKLRAEAAAREQADREAERRKQFEAQALEKLRAEQAQKDRLEQEARQKSEAEAAAKAKSEEEARSAAEAAETALRLSTLDRQHIQAALSALGFSTGALDGVFGAHTREEVAAWQKSRGFPPTGYLTGPQNQALLRDAAPAIAKFDDDQKKAEEARKKAEEEKAKAEAAARAAPAPPPAAGPNPAGPVSAGPDGVWSGRYHCTPAQFGGEFQMNIMINVSGGSGTWFRPGAPATGNQSLSIRIQGSTVYVTRAYHPNPNPAKLVTASMTAQMRDGVIGGTGPELNSGGRTCDINMRKIQ